MDNIHFPNTTKKKIMFQKWKNKKILYDFSKKKSMQLSI